MKNVTWRAARQADARHLLQLFRSAEHEAPVGLETDLAGVRSRLAANRLDLDRDTFVTVDRSGLPVVYAEAADMGAAGGKYRIRLTRVIHPGLGTSMDEQTTEWLRNRALQMRQERHPGIPTVLGTRCGVSDRSRVELLAAMGFQIVHWQQEFVRSLDEPVVRLPGPQSVAITPYDHRDDEAARVAHNDAYADSPAALLPEADAWPSHATGLPSFLSQASFLAKSCEQESEGEIVGFLFSLEQQDFTNQRQASLHCLGTRPRWRSRGVASALIGCALYAYRAAGYRKAALKVNSSSADAARLYTTMGFRDTGRSVAVLMSSIL